MQLAVVSALVVAVVGSPRLSTAFVLLIGLLAAESVAVLVTVELIARGRITRPTPGG